MGLGNSTTVINYLQIVNGKFALKVDAATRTSVSRMNRNNQLVQEELYGQCGGYLTNVSFEDGNFGQELHIEITERGVKYKIQTLAVSNYAEDFLSRLLNVKLDQVIELHVFEEKVVNDDETTYMKGVLFIKDENNKNISKYFSAQNRKNLPEWEKTTDEQGKTKWDKTKRIEFYKNMVKQFVFPTQSQPVAQPQAQRQIQTNPMPAPGLSNQGGGNSEDLPF